MTNKEIIVRLVRNSLQMHPWEVRERVIEQELLIQIEFVTNKETAETIRDICASVKNDYCFYQYLCMLYTVLEAILISDPIDDIIKVIDNCIKGETIYTLIEKHREMMMDHELLDDFAKSMECSRVRVQKNKSALREMYTFKMKDKDRIRIQTRQQGGTLKYKRYELRIYGIPLKMRTKYEKISGSNPSKLPTTYGYKEGEQIMLHIDLSQLAGGTLQEKFDREIAKVIDNMQDPNTPFSDKRGITINISFTQNETRDDAKIEISLKTKLAGVLSAKTNFAMGKDLRSGEVMVREYGKQIPGQMSFSDIDQSADDAKVTPIQPRKLGAN